MKLVIKSLVFCCSAVSVLFTNLGCERIMAKRNTLNASQKWALAAPAIVKHANQMELDVLGGGPASREYVSDLVEMLKTDWGVVDRSSALREIESLKDHGHRKDFDDMVKHAEKLNEKEFNEFIKQFSGQSSVLKALWKVRSGKDTARLRERSIIAWDFSRVIYLAECSCRAGYLKEEEAWPEIMSAAKVLQPRFSSWEEMGDNYLLGREFWSGSNDPKIYTASRFLLSDRKGPWVKLPWNTPLD